MSVIVADEAALRALVREEVRLALEPVLAALARLGPAQGATAADGLLTREEVAALLRVNARDLRRLVLEGAFPPPIKVGGRRLRWRRKTVTRWLDAAERSRLHGAVNHQTADHRGAAG
jgi:predicted DNA-binding transcriptional regulator AlpA